MPVQSVFRLPLFLLFLRSGFSCFAFAQAPAPTAPDVLTFTNGDKLTGHLQSSKGKDVIFKSDMAGDFTVDWSKIKELNTANQFAVIPKNVKVHRGVETPEVPQGTLAVASQKIEVQKQPSGAGPTVPTGDTAFVVDQNAYQKAVFHSPGFLHGWTGDIAAGVTLVEATQKSKSFSGAVNAVRTDPGVSWLDRRQRTTFGFSFAYGKLSEPNTPTIKTDIYHVGLEHDWYIKPRLYVFGAVAYDHNFSQGLDLQQRYGGGLGWTAILTEKEELDFKGSVDYIKQQFTNSALNQDLIGSTFSEAYSLKLPRSILFTQGVSVTPAWNNTNAYSAHAYAGLALPIYKHFSLTLDAIDAFLNNPPPGFKKNSFQFITALAYSFQ